MSGQRRSRPKRSHYQVCRHHLLLIPHTDCYNTGQQKNQGKSAVEEVIRLRKSRDSFRDQVKTIQTIIADTATPDWQVITAELELESAKDSLRRAEGMVKNKEGKLGVNEKQKLEKLLQSPFLSKRMNALALKTRIREHLRNRKFDLDHLERSYRKQHSGESSLRFLNASIDNV